MNIMKRTYPVSIHPQADGFYLIEIPDFQNATMQSVDWSRAD